MNTIQRAHVYGRTGRDLTPAQRRRLVKKAQREPGSIIIREDGMGFARSRQGEHLLVGFEEVQPVSGAPISAADIDLALMDGE